MKKKNNFEGFYEDEESLKMLDIIRENANKQDDKKVDENKLFTRLEIVFIVCSVLFIATAIILIYVRMGDDALNSCQQLGNSLEYCEAHI